MCPNWSWSVKESPQLFLLTSEIESNQLFPPSSCSMISQPLVWQFPSTYRQAVAQIWSCWQVAAEATTDESLAVRSLSFQWTSHICLLLDHIYRPYQSLSCHSDSSVGGHWRQCVPPWDHSSGRCSMPTSQLADEENRVLEKPLQSEEEDEMTGGVEALGCYRGSSGLGDCSTPSQPLKARRKPGKPWVAGTRHKKLNSRVHL